MSQSSISGDINTNFFESINSPFSDDNIPLFTINQLITHLKNIESHNSELHDERKQGGVFEEHDALQPLPFSSSTLRVHLSEHEKALTVILSSQNIPSEFPLHTRLFYRRLFYFLQYLYGDSPSIDKKEVKNTPTTSIYHRLLYQTPIPRNFLLLLGSIWGILSRKNCNWSKMRSQIEESASTLYHLKNFMTLEHSEAMIPNSQFSYWSNILFQIDCTHLPVLLKKNSLLIMIALYNIIGLLYLTFFLKCTLQTYNSKLHFIRILFVVPNMES